MDGSWTGLKQSCLIGLVCAAGLGWEVSASAQPAAPQADVPQAEHKEDVAVDTGGTPQAELVTTEAEQLLETGAGSGSESIGGLSRQVELVTELASAYRLHNEIRVLLAGIDSGATVLDEVSAVKLTGLATRCEVLVNSSSFDQSQFVLVDSQARIYAALAEAAGGEDRTAKLRQLRVVADQLTAINAPAAASSGAYWRLLADLADTSRSSASLVSRQALSEHLLSDYVEVYRHDPEAEDYLIDARLSLAALLDQRGDQPGVAEQLDAIQALPPGSPREIEAGRLRARVERIGMPIKLEAITTALDVWRLADHAGQPVLLHVYADSIEPSVAMIGSLQRRIASDMPGGFAVASLRIGQSISGTATPPWPTLPIEIQAGGVIERLAIDALPTLIWIDASGRLASAGYSLDVLDQYPVFELPVPAEIEQERESDQAGESPESDALESDDGKSATERPEVRE